MEINPTDKEQEMLELSIVFDEDGEVEFVVDEDEE